MKYQLVLQWPAPSIKDYDEMIRIEGALIGALGDFALVDGHDMGSGERNIFLVTDDPTQAFEKARYVLQSEHALDGLKAAFRVFAEDDYTILWPPGLASFSVG